MFKLPAFVIATMFAAPPVGSDSATTDRIEARADRATKAKRAKRAEKLEFNKAKRNRKADTKHQAHNPAKKRNRFKASLTEEQNEQIRRVYRGLKHETSKLTADMKSLRRALASEFAKDTPDVDAMDGDDPAKLVDEAGDLLFQVLFIAEVISEKGPFDLTDVITAIHDKLVRRHPHVFSDVSVKDSDEVLKNWETIKERERSEEASGSVSALDGVSLALPALVRAAKLGRRASRVGSYKTRCETAPLPARSDRCSASVRRGGPRSRSRPTSDRQPAPRQRSGGDRVRRSVAFLVETAPTRRPITVLPRSSTV